MEVRAGSRFSKSERERGRVGLEQKLRRPTAKMGDSLEIQLPYVPRGGGEKVEESVCSELYQNSGGLSCVCETLPNARHKRRLVEEFAVGTLGRWERITTIEPLPV